MQTFYITLWYMEAWNIQYLRLGSSHSDFFLKWVDINWVLMYPPLLTTFHMWNNVHEWMHSRLVIITKTNKTCKYICVYIQIWGNSGFIRHDFDSIMFERMKKHLVPLHMTKVLKKMTFSNKKLQGSACIVSTSTMSRIVLRLHGSIGSR